MATLSPQNISAISKRIQGEYLQCADVQNTTRCRIFDEGGECKATPAKMQELVDRLRAQTDAVANAQSYSEYFIDEATKAAARALLGPMASEMQVLKHATIIADKQWMNDWSNWNARLDMYQSALDDVKRDHPESWSTSDGCKYITKSLIDPLLFGWFWKPMPGIMQTGAGQYDVQTRADWAAPFILGNGLKVYRDAMKEAADGLWEDLATGGRDDPSKWDPWDYLKIALAIAGVGVAVYGISQISVLAERLTALREARYGAPEQRARDARRRAARREIGPEGF